MLSLVTPSFHQKSYLERCLSAVAHLDGVDEHVVADGGSSDGSVEVLQNFAAKHMSTQRLFSFLSDKDDGMYQALNRGMARTHGDILGYINCDDVLLPWAPSMVRAIFTQNPRVDIVYGDAIEADEAGGVLSITPPAWMLGRYFRGGGFLPQPSVFFRRRVWDDLGGFDESFKLLGDHDFWLRAHERGFCFRKAWEVLSVQWMSDGQLMSRRRDEAMRESARIRHTRGWPSTSARAAKTTSRVLHRFAIAAWLFDDAAKDHPLGWKKTRASGLARSTRARLWGALLRSTQGTRYLDYDNDPLPL